MPGGVEGGGEKPPPIRLNCGGYNVGNEDIMVRRNDKSDCGMLQDQQCGMIHDRDINAARNVLAAGLAVSALGESVNPVCT